MRKLAVLAVATALVAATAYAASKNVGTVKVTDPNMAVELTFAGTKQKVTVNGKGVPVPEGSYTVESYSVMVRTRGGTLWTLECSGNLGDLASLTVEKGKTAEIDMGPPLKFTPIVYRSSVDKTGKLIVPVGFAVQGKRGESYSPGFKMGARTVPAPLFQIVDDNNKVLAEGKFEYG